MGEFHLLIEVLFLLMAVLLFVPLFQRLKLGSVLAYLTAGVVIGPSGLDLIKDLEATRPVAELGVVFLLFTVGLEVSLARLKVFGRDLFGLAIAQVLLTTLIFAAAAYLLGFSASAAVVIGGALTFSSTAVALQLLSERGQMTGALGRTAVAVLLIQDLAVAPFLIFISTASGGTAALAGTLGATVLKFTLFLVLIWLFDQQVLRRLLKVAVAAQAPEVFMASALLLVLGAGWVSEKLGLSMALGAFAAGMLVAGTEFRHQVAADIQPFRGLLLGLFFMTVGMGLDLGYTLEHGRTLLLLVAVVIAAKALVLIGLAAVVFRVPLVRALALGGLLSQMSEFAFVLMALAVQAGVVRAEIGQLITAAAAVTMATTPLGALLIERLFPAGIAALQVLRSGIEESDKASGHVVVAGFGQVGMAVTRYLIGEHVPTVVLDLSAKRVTTCRARGLPVFYGNAARVDVLRAAHLDSAHALVVAVPDPAAGEQITSVARQSFPTLPIFVRAPDENWVPKLKAAGADAVVLDGLTTALDFAERVMLVYVPKG
jgi:CPA2 family monovalent cation:H+ antiporter-2